VNLDLSGVDGVSWNPSTDRLRSTTLRAGPLAARFDIERTLGNARALHQAGRLAEAEALYRQIFATDPNHADCLHLLGVIAQQRGQNELAVELIGKAIARNHRVADFHCNIGNALGALGRVGEAQAHYQRAIKLDPRHPESCNNLGNLLKDQGELPDAEKQIRRALALRPGYADAHYNLGNVLLDSGRAEEAINEYRQAITRQPRMANAHYNLAHALKEQGRLAEAAEAYEHALAVSPDWRAARLTLGTLLHELGRLAEAEACFRRAHEAHPQASEGLDEWAQILDLLGSKDKAIEVRQCLCELEPQQVKPWFELGLAFQRSHRAADALAAYQRGLAIDPDYPYLRNNLAAAHIELEQAQPAIKILEPLVEEQPNDGLAWINLGGAYRSSFQLERSVAAFERAIAVAPNNPLGYSNYGLTLKELQRWDDARSLFERALAIDPDYVGARWNLAMVQLVQGNYAQGWINHEARWEGSPELRGKPRGGLLEPLWEGEPLSGKTLFVWGEQGFGDALQFARYVPLIAERVKRESGHMVYCCFGQLLPLFRRSFQSQVEVIFPDDTRPLPQFDCHCPLLSLPLRFGTTLETVPARTPYLILDRDKVEAWRARLAHEPRLKVALVWNGKPDHQRNPFRAVGLQAYATAFKNLRNVAFYSLQFGAAEAIRQSAAGGFEISDYTSEMFDYDDSAAFLRNMDLLITVCTSTAHLAGAIAAPTWLLLDVNPHWVWHLDRSDSPWYPMLTLYRQESYREWGPVMSRVSADLAKLAQRHNDKSDFN
jgi:tetratricopeptide (TPR) repeat protein